MTDDGYPSQVSAGLAPYVPYAFPHSVHTFDTAKVDTADGCKTPGGADLYISGGADVTVRGSHFANGFASNANGGAVSSGAGLSPLKNRL